MLRWVFGLVCVLSALPASADEVDDLVAKGQELGKKNEYTQAIAAFKQADALRPRAAHACMIGLAYMRREAWPQAELFFALCEKRAVPGDQPPEWFDGVRQQLAEKLRAAQIPAISIEIAPPVAGALLSVSSFAPDEKFAPQTIHLAPGTHVIEVTATGYFKATRAITVEAAQPQTVTFALESDGSSPSPPGARRGEPPGGDSRVWVIPWAFVGAGALLVGIGVAYDFASLQPARDQLASSQTGVAYDTRLADFQSKQSATLALFVSGTVIAATGLVLRFTAFSTRARVTAQLAPSGGMLAIGWQQ